MMEVQGPIVYLITPGNSTSLNFTDQKKLILGTIEMAVSLGVPLVQVREKRLSSRHLFQLAEEACSLARGSETRILVNDRIDIAVAAGADGVHLTSRSFPIATVRQHFGPHLIIGASVHDRESAVQAKEAGADLVLFGPVYETPGKGKAVGVDALADVCRSLGQFPVVALGGINSKNWHSALRAGASGFAAIRALNDEDSLSEIMSEITKL